MNTIPQETVEQDNANELSLKDYWETIVRYRFTFMLVMVIVMGTTMSMSLFNPQKYSAQAKLLSLVIENDADSMLRAFGKPSVIVDVGTMSKIATSKKVVPKITERMNEIFNEYKNENVISSEELFIVQNVSHSFVKRFIRLSNDPESQDIITVSATINDAPFLCAALVNATSEVLLDQLTENNRRTLKLEIDNPNNSIISNNKQIDDINEEMSNIQRRANKDQKVNLDERRLTLRLDSFENQLSQAELKYKEITDQIQMIKVDFGIQDVPLDQVKWIDSSSSMHQKLQNLKFEREELLTRYKPENLPLRNLIIKFNLSNLL